MKFPTLSRKLGHQLVSLRQKMGMTQAQLARRSGISLKYISMVESGTNPSLKTILKLCDALDVAPVEMVDRARNMRTIQQRKKRVSPLNVTVPTDCPAFRQLLRFIRRMDREQRHRALEIIRSL